MRFVTFKQPGGPEVLEIGEGPSPKPGPGELLIRVRASALNRADTIQRQGIYVPPPDQSQIMGVEIAGDVAEIGEGVEGIELGDRVFGLCNGGGYAEYCLLDANMAVPIPKVFSYSEAAAMPEAYFTSHETMVELGGLKEGQSVLIHAGGSGIGTGAIQIAHHLGARVLTTAGSASKLAHCRKLGADVVINYKDQDFVAAAREATDGRGVDLIMDFIGASYLKRNLETLAQDGTLLLVGVLDGWECEIDLLYMIMNRLQMKAFSMRGQSQARKVGIKQRFMDFWLPRLSEGQVRPIIHAEFALEEVAEAHRMIESNQNVGKIILTID